MLHNVSEPARHIFWGDILLIGCCFFYLLWWILASKPVGAVKGLRSGWLLIPAFLLGICAVVMIVRGTIRAGTDGSFFSIKFAVLAGVVSYIVLLAVTWLVFHRQVTTELFLIVAWTVLAFLEVNALFNLGIITRNGAFILFTLAAISAILSMVCYMLYYTLDVRKGYVDGMVPLLLVAAFMTVLSVCIVRA